MLSIDKKYLFNLRIAISALFVNKARTALTMLGVIFGVAAVISMLAIGEGAEQEILKQIKLVGVNNIVIKSHKNQKTDTDNTASAKIRNSKFSAGLTLLDIDCIKKTLPQIENVSPEIEVKTNVIREGIRKSTKLMGVHPDYFKLMDWQLISGRLFSQKQLVNAAPVCVLGYDLSKEFFKTENPLGKYIKCGNLWFQVIGILEQKEISKTKIGKLGIRNINYDIYMPVQTMMVRVTNRSRITKSMVEKSSSMLMESEEMLLEYSKPNAPSKDYNQLDRIIVQMNDTKILKSAAEVISRMLERLHYGVVDFEVIIPELLLKQQQRTKNIFNIVLGAIAGISLIVGGIGIMNIMLASVLERTREIGVRLSVGATKQDIIQQFMLEAIAISLIGGLIGILLGVTLSFAITKLANIATVVSFFSIFISFGVAALVGIISGIMPAQKAAKQDPVESLRHE